MSDIIVTVDDEYDDADLLVHWLHELTGSEPNAAVVASLEDVAEDRGWHPYDAWRALTAAPPSRWTGDLHPRGRDGKFINAFAMVELFDVPGAEPGQRGKVTSIAPNRKTPGRPDILVQLVDPKTGQPGRKMVNVKPEQLGAAPEKARLTTPGGKGPGPGPGDAFDEPGQRIGRTMFPGKAPTPDSPEVKEQRLAADEVRGATDEELARQRTLGPDVWRNAVAQEQANRQARRAQDDAARQKLMADVNEQAALLSTTDPEERAKGLDAILAKLRFSIIDTDKVHDHIYPPGESGRWTPERTAQHEQMWDDLLSQVEAANIPQDRDALVLGGLPGAGKSFMLKPGQKAERFGVVSWEPNGELPEGVTHVSINPDIVKEMLIQRGMLPEGISQDLKPMEQVTFLHEESSYVAKLFSERLGRLGYNIVLDNTMDSEGGMLKRMTPLARKGYKFRGIFADIPQEESLASARKRYIDAALTPQGGRFVPSSVQGNRGSTKGTMSKNRDAMDTLVADDWFTEWMIVDNTGVSQRTPKGDIVGEGTGAGSAAGKHMPANDPAPAPAPAAPPAATPA